MQDPRTRVVLGCYLHQKGICPYCRRQITPENVTWEHVIPRGWGGPNTRPNVVLACHSCNSAKSMIETLISNRFHRELDLGSRAALFMLRCVKIAALKAKKRKVPKEAYLRMAVEMQETVDAWLREGRVSVPELTDQTRGIFI